MKTRTVTPWWNSKWVYTAARIPLNVQPRSRIRAFNGVKGTNRCAGPCCKNRQLKAVGYVSG